MDKLALVVKSYLPDALRAKRCIATLQKHNKDNIPVYLLIKKEEEAEFIDIFDDVIVNIINDEEIATPPPMGGWLYQQIIKSQFWTLGLAENYVTVDSDHIYFKDFYTSDFMADDDTPYIVLGERKDFLDEAWKLNRVTVHQDLRGRDMLGARITKSIKAIRDIIPNKLEKFYDYGTAPYIFNSEVWKSFYDNYLVKNNMTFTDLAIALNNQGLMSESCIYGEYYIYSNIKKILPCSPLVKCYHDKEHWEWDKEQGVTVEDLKHNYLGYCCQSNWAEDTFEL